MTVSDCLSDVHRGVGDDGEHLIEGSDWVGGMLCDVFFNRETRYKNREEKRRERMKQQRTEELVDWINAEMRRRS